MQGSITISKEDYLKAILEAESEGIPVISATLAHWLSVSAPAVTMALRRLKKDGLVRVTDDGRVHVTAAGKEIATRLMVRHHLIERMLAEIFGMDWTLVHGEAERLEHAVSSHFEARLLEKLGRGGICPHGNTVRPESPLARRRRGLVLLADGQVGHRYMVSSIYERDTRLLQFLDRLAVRPGAIVRILGRNYDETVTLETAKGRVTVGKPAADKVWIKHLRASQSSAR